MCHAFMEENHSASEGERQHCRTAVHLGNTITAQTSLLGNFPNKSQTGKGKGGKGKKKGKGKKEGKGTTLPSMAYP